MNATELFTNTSIRGSMQCLTIEKAKDWCRNACRELINKSIFDDSMWMLFAGVATLVIYGVFRYNITKVPHVKLNLEARGYNVDRVDRNLHWILIAGILLILAFIIRFLVFTHTIKPLG